MTATVTVSSPLVWAAPATAVGSKNVAAKISGTATAARPTDAPQSRIATKVSLLKSSSRASAPASSTPASKPVTIVETATPEKSADVRLAAVGIANTTPDGNAPAAAPPDEQPGLEVPIDREPDENAGPDLPAAPDAGTGETAPPETTVTTSPATETPELAEGGLTPAAAEGREIASVRVAGNRVVNDTVILLAATNIKVGSAYSSRLAEADLRRIRDLGFFAGIEQQILPNLQEPDKVDITFVVIENRVVSAFRIEGNKEIPSSQILPVIVSKTRAVLNSKTVDADVKAIQGVYSQRGFAALVTDVKQEDNGTVIYTIQEGVISRIDFDGLRKTSPSLVRGIINSKPGMPFNETKIQQDLNRIYDTGFFEDVTYKVADDPEKPGALIVTITLKEKRTGQFTLGAGFDSRSKISGFAGISESNFRGSGKNVSAQVELGSQRSFDLGFGDRYVGKQNASYQFNIYKRQTFRDPQTTRKILGGSSSSNQTFNYQEQRTGLRFNFTQPLDFERTNNYLVGYRNESVKLTLDNNNNGVPTDLPPNSSGRISAASLGFLHDGRDLRLDPSNGLRALLVLEQGFGLLGGTANFTKADLDIRVYRPLIGIQKKGELPKLVLAIRGVAGQTIGQLPAFEQYFVGGADTIRGNNDSAAFGDNQVYGNVELRFRFQRKLQFVAFADGGGAWGGEFSSSKSLAALFGVGVGVRLQTPIGPVRLDIAKGNDGMKTHFGIGPSF